MNETITYPDDSGWFWFKSSAKSAPMAVFIADDGVANFLDENGQSGELDDLIGIWEQADISI